ncbi:MAG: patatin-like phospholipase family protein [Holosporaceae bacterium]|nr:patatin-like phospholipase family protein [Holosporaceae bacterium]
MVNFKRIVFSFSVSLSYVLSSGAMVVDGAPDAEEGLPQFIPIVGQGQSTQRPVGRARSNSFAKNHATAGSHAAGNAAPVQIFSGERHLPFISPMPRPNGVLIGQQRAQQHRGNISGGNSSLGVDQLSGVVDSQQRGRRPRSISDAECFTESHTVFRVNDKPNREASPDLPIEQSPPQDSCIPDSNQSCSRDDSRLIVPFRGLLDASDRQSESQVDELSDSDVENSQQCAQFGRRRYASDRQSESQANEYGDRTMHPSLLTAPGLTDLQAPEIWLNTKIILSIDGGGSRGIIPAYMLKVFEDNLNRRINGSRSTGRNGRIHLIDTIDMVAGTSVGALIGAGVIFKRVEDTYNQFPKTAKKIFGKRKFSVSHKYKSKGRRKEIHKVVGDARVAEIENKQIVVPFLSYSTSETKVCQNFGGDIMDVKYKDVLLATSAAPTYFSPHHFESANGHRYSGGDGGLFANNPALIAYQAARREYGDCHIVLISLGTGTTGCATTDDHYDRLSLVKWATIFPDIAIKASSDLCHRQLVQLSENDPRLSYYRIQPILQEGCMKMDNVKRSIFDLNKNTVRQFISENRGQLSPFSMAENAFEQVARSREISQASYAGSEVSEAEVDNSEEVGCLCFG